MIGVNLDIIGRELHVDDYVIVNVRLSIDRPVKMVLARIITFNGYCAYLECFYSADNTHLWREPNELCKIEKTDAVSFILNYYNT